MLQEAHNVNDMFWSKVRSRCPDRFEGRIICSPRVAVWALAGPNARGQQTYESPSEPLKVQTTTQPLFLQSVHTSVPWNVTPSCINYVDFCRASCLKPEGDQQQILVARLRPRTGRPTLAASHSSGTPCLMMSSIPSLPQTFQVIQQTLQRPLASTHQTNWLRLGWFATPTHGVWNRQEERFLNPRAISKPNTKGPHLGSVQGPAEGLINIPYVGNPARPESKRHLIPNEALRLLLLLVWVPM